MKHHFLPVLALSLAGLLCWNPAWADKHGRRAHDAPPAGPSALQHRHPLSLEEAVSRVQRQYGGRVLSAERRDDEYRVRVLTSEGRVKRFRMDPRTGRFR